LAAQGDAAGRDQLARAEKMRALGEMAGGIVHDLNQNLNLIVGHAQIALRSLADPSAERAGSTDLPELLAIIAQAALEGAEKLKRLQSFAKPSDDEPPERFELGELVRETAQLTSPRWKDMPQAQGRPIRLLLEVEGETAMIGRPVAVREALTNLIFNAVDAMPEGGLLRLSVTREEGDVVVEVADTGTGMTAEVRARLFEPFFTTKGAGGTGLGLVNVFGAVERHDGRVEVDTAPGRGTTFRLLFPAAPFLAPTAPARRVTDGAAAGPLRRIAEGAPRDGRAQRILVVDDEPKMCRMVVRMLQPGGHQVVEAYSAEQALEHLQAGPFDLVISDLGLGTGMNGWELAERVRDEYSRTRFVLATGWGGSIDEERAKAFNVAGIVGKPYSIDALLAVVEAD
jgi:two-component system cell cycle sensor histidine kinase/response regulator CckA